MTDINTKLFIVEGPPCSGKSETARFIADLVAESGNKVSFFDDNDMNHPADYAFHAYMTEEQIGALTQEERRQLYSESIKMLAGYIIPLTKISVSLFGKVIPYKIYDRLDWETERPVMLELWRNFADKARVNSTSNVFNGCFLQNPINETMMRFDFPYAEISAYIHEIYRLIAPANPVVIYLKCSDIGSRIDETSGNRKAVWLSSAIPYHTSQGFGKRNNMTGFDGYIACLEARQKTELGILDKLPIRKLILTDPFDDWDSAWDKISEFVTGKSLMKRF